MLSPALEPEIRGLTRA
jgi:inositol phosphorylceramide mannosyltransferase catalytic subunit